MGYLAVGVEWLAFWIGDQFRYVLANELVETDRAVSSILSCQMAIPLVIALGALDRTGEDESHRDSGTAQFYFHGCVSARRSSAGSAGKDY